MGKSKAVATCHKAAPKAPRQAKTKKSQAETEAPKPKIQPRKAQSKPKPKSGSQPLLSFVAAASNPVASEAASIPMEVDPMGAQGVDDKGKSDADTAVGKSVDVDVAMAEVEAATASEAQDEVGRGGGVVKSFLILADSSPEDPLAISHYITPLLFLISPIGSP